MQITNEWHLEQLKGNTTSKTFRDPATGEWSSARATLHGSIINDLLAGMAPEKDPQLWVVTGGVGSGSQH